MTDRDRSFAADYYDKTFYDENSIVPGIQLLLAIAKKVKRSILDYALGAAILGIIPVYGRLIPLIRVILLLSLNFKMSRDIARFWGYHRRQNWGETISCIFGIFSSLVLGFIAWLIVLLLAIWIPFIDILARAIAYGVLTFNIGRTVSHYYYSPQSLDLKALQKALKFHQLGHNK